MATSELISFAYPPDLAIEDLRPEAQATSSHVGTYLVYDRQLQGKPRTAVGKVTRVFVVGDQLEIQLFEVPTHERFGPWLRRPWAPADCEPEVITFKEVIAKVDLQNGVLTQDDLDSLEHQGIHAHAAGREKVASQTLNLVKVMSTPKNSLNIERRKGRVDSLSHGKETYVHL